MPRPHQNGVFDFDSGFIRNGGVFPVAGAVLDLTKDGNPDSIGAKFSVKYINIQLKPFAGGFRGGVPIGEDDAAESIGRIDGHE